jgi:O-methyltransferase
MVAMAEDTPPGAFVEIGVYKGGSAWHLAQAAARQGRELYLYDTFSGMPFSDPGDSHSVGDFRDTSLEAVQAAIPAAHCIVGTFPETLVDMGPVAFVHADCDQYRSVHDVATLLPPLMVDGGIIVFDDYGCLDAATRAVHDVFGTPQLTKAGKAWVRVSAGAIAQ